VSSDVSTEPSISVFPARFPQPAGRIDAGRGVVAGPSLALLPGMPRASQGARLHDPVQYRDPKGRTWQASEVAQLRVVSPAIDGPNLCLVIRFEREGEERFAHWLGGESWRSQRALDRLFGEAEGGVDPGTETGVGPAPAETIALWVNAVATMGPDELESFEERTFRQWDRASLGDVRRAIERRRKELAR
jgi:hypothetical protein